MKGKYKVERVKTGVSGADQILNGGIPKNNLVLLAGNCGTGKTTFGMEFLIEGAKKGETGVFVSMEESLERLRRNAKIFGWDLEKLEEEEKIVIIKPELYKYDNLLSDIEDAVDSVDAKRLVIDSITILSSYFKDEFELRRNLLELSDMFKRLKCTTLAISEIEEGSNKLSRFGIEEFAVDGIIILHYKQRKSTYFRGISIRKMKSSSHSKKIHPLEIGGNGIEIYPGEEIFTDF
ncbi:MAG: RAD55 family ATPase [Candidatus Aenigmatarchaeota archaeon]